MSGAPVSFSLPTLTQGEITPLGSFYILLFTPHPEVAQARVPVKVPSEPQPIRPMGIADRWGPSGSKHLNTNFPGLLSNGNCTHLWGMGFYPDPRPTLKS